MRSFHPLGEIINSNQDKFVSIRAGGSIRPMTFMPQAKNGQGELIVFSSCGGIWIKSRVSDTYDILAQTCYSHFLCHPKISDS